MGKPTAAFNEYHAKGVVQLLKEFVDTKGLVQDPDKLHSRRPRTCIFTTDRFTKIPEADKIYSVSYMSGITELSVDDEHALRRSRMSKSNASLLQDGSYEPCCAPRDIIQILI